MKYTFKELIDVPVLQALTDELYSVASIPSAIVTMDGEILTGSGWQRICTDFHRRHPKIEKECTESDTNISRKLKSGEPFVIYKCPRGLVDASSPIIIDGEHVANVFSGQVFLERPDETTVQFFREQAWKFGFDEVEYIEAFREVPIFTEKRFRAGIVFLVKFSQSIAEMGLTRLRELEGLETLRESEERLRIQNQIANIFLTKGDEDMYGEMLSVVLDIMESKFGVFGYIDEQGDLVCPSMTKDIWDQCQISDKTVVFPENTWGDSIWGNGLRTGLAEYSNKPFKVPEGHISVERCLTTPIMYQRKSIGLFVVANKPTDYTESDKQLFEEIAEHAAPVLNARIEKERSDKALRESEEYHRDLFENSPTALYLQDFTGIEEQVKGLKSAGISDLGSYLRENPEVAFQLSRGVTISGVNQAAVDLYKAGSQEKLIGTLDQVIIKGDSQHFIDQVVAFTNGKDAWAGEARNYNFQREIIDIVIRKGIINRRVNGMSKVLVSITDVTELHQAHKKRERLEAELQQAQKMEAMGILAGGIAHDFNNLLMAIQGRTSIMLMKKDSSHPDNGHLKGIEDNVESAADLTRQLLGFARGGKYEVKPTDLNELIKKQNRMFGRTKKEITIRGKYGENLWSVDVDQGQIDQVLLNLYVNAWQAMPAGGDLYLETENVALDENYVKPFSVEPGRYVKISVTDTGTGMDKATRAKIFEPFFTTKEMGRGTGLGLASAYGIIKNHGGFINVYSEKGHGTAFNIYLPASEEEIIEEKKAAVDTLRGTETVLFVDDEEMIIEVASEVLENLGYNVLTARSGKEACEIYEKNKEQIDIVLLDMIMPDMSGSDTYDRMKKIDPDIKVLLSSGYSINGQATEIMDRGCNGFIQKPFKMKELSQKLREILDD